MLLDLLQLVQVIQYGVFSLIDIEDVRICSKKCVQQFFRRDDVSMMVSNLICVIASQT